MWSARLPSRVQFVAEMPETFNLYRKWASRTPPLLAMEAVQTAATAVGVEPMHGATNAQRNDREGMYYVGAASTIRGFDEEIDLTIIVRVTGLQRPIEGHVQGVDYGRCRHALDAAAHVMPVDSPAGSPTERA